MLLWKVFVAYNEKFEQNLFKNDLIQNMQKKKSHIVVIFDRYCTMSHDFSGNGKFCGSFFNEKKMLIAVGVYNKQALLLKLVPKNHNASFIMGCCDPFRIIAAPVIWVLQF